MLWRRLTPLLFLFVTVPLWAVLTGDYSVFTGKNDFLTLYTGGVLAGTHNMYDEAANRRVQVERASYYSEYENFMRPPFAGLFFKPLTWMPYRTAYWVWQLISFSALAGFVLLLIPRQPELAGLCAASVPVYTALLNGQDVLVLLFCAALSIRLFEAHHKFAAGVILSLCAVKIHIFGWIGLGLLLCAEWRFLAGAVTGSGILGLLSISAAGPSFLRDYIAILNSPHGSPKPNLMGNLNMLVHSAGQLLVWADLPIHVAVAAAFGFAVWRDRNVQRMFAYALVAGILLSRHAYSQDFVVLLLAFALLTPVLLKRESAAFRFVLLPFLYFALFSETALGIFLPLAVLGLFAYLCSRAASGWTSHPPIAFLRPALQPTLSPPAV